MDYLDSFSQKLAELKVLDPRRSIGESWNHDYSLNPPVADSIVAGIETKYEFSFPEEYRLFITQLGDGGAGPAYGLFPLSDVIPAKLCPNLPFPYSKPKRIEYSDDQTGADLEQLTAFYKDPRNEHGKIVISEVGCGIMIDLIVTGDAAGQVGIDDRTQEWGGLYPFDEYKSKEPLQFFEWYDTWLDRTLKKAKSNAKRRKQKSG